MGNFTLRMFVSGCATIGGGVSSFTDDISIDRSKGLIGPARRACLDLYLPACFLAMRRQERGGYALPDDIGQAALHPRPSVRHKARILSGGGVVSRKFKGEESSVAL